MSFSQVIWDEFVEYLENKESSAKETLLENLFFSIWCAKPLSDNGWAVHLQYSQAKWLKDYCKKNYNDQKEKWLYWALPLTTITVIDAVDENPVDIEKFKKKFEHGVCTSLLHANRLAKINCLLNGKDFYFNQLIVNNNEVFSEESLELLLPRLRNEKLGNKITAEFFLDGAISFETGVIKQVLAQTTQKSEEEVLTLLNKTPNARYSAEFVKAWIEISAVLQEEFDPEKIESVVNTYPAVFDAEAISAFWAKNPNALIAHKWRTNMNDLIPTYSQLYRTSSRKSFNSFVEPSLEKALSKVGVCVKFSDSENLYRINLYQVYDEALGAQVVNKDLLLGSVKWIAFEQISKNLESFKEHLKDVFAEKQEFFKIGFLIILCEHIAKNLTLNLEEVVQQTTERVRGWYDLSKVLTPAGQWVLIEYRKTEKELTLDKFVSHYGPLVSREQNYIERGGAAMVTTEQSPFFVYRPFDPRGGFVVNTYLAICEKYSIDPWPSTEDMLKQWANCTSATIAAARNSAMYLTYLYGMDVDAIDKKITDLAQVELDSAKKKRTAVYNAAKTLQKPIPAVEAEVMRTWRPLLIKYPKVLKYAVNLKKVAPIENAEAVTEAQAIGLMIQHHYENVPEALAMHMLHALENSWDQSVVDHFVELNESAKTESYIPNIKFEKNGVKVYCLEPGDPVALYVGELSGCCQHINDGGGDDAAIQSFTEPWCSVLMIESANSGTLLAQSFLWTCQDKKYVVMDSVESVLETSNQSVRNLVYPALCSWIKKMKEAGFKVAISDATYGLTDTLRELFEEDDDVRVEAIPAPESYDGLDYTDVSSEVYKIKVVN